MYVTIPCQVSQIVRFSGQKYMLFEGIAKCNSKSYLHTGRKIHKVIYTQERKIHIETVFTLYSEIIYNVQIFVL